MMLIDAGPGTLRQLAALGHDALDLDAVGITHRHPDHTLDLLHLFFATRYARRAPRVKPLTLFGPPGLAAFLDAMTAAWGHWMEASTYDRPVIELKPGDEIVLGRFTVRARAMAHLDVSLGFRIEDPGGAVLACTGDTGLSTEAVELARGADLLVIECSTGDDDPLPGHLTPSGVAAILREARPARAVLVHLYADGHEEDRPAAVRQAGYEGPVSLGADGDSFELDGRRPARA